MKFIFLLVLSLIIISPLEMARGVVVTQAQARPASIQILLPQIVTDQASYAFEIVLSETKTKNGTPLIRAVTTITKVSGGKTIRIKEITQTVQVDATQFTVAADGRDFVFEAGYTDVPAAEGVPPRDIPTTLSQMFGGGPVGLKVRLL